MILAIIHAPDFTQAHYEALRPIVRWELEHPKGALLHVCAFDEVGGLRVVDVWESAEAMKEFFDTRLQPGMEQVGIAPIEPAIYPVYNVDAFPGIEKLTP